MSHYRPLALMLGASLAMACGGSDPVTPPQRVDANVQLKAQDILVFAGQKLSLRSLVLRVTDANGAPITDYELEAVLPAGWKVRNDSVIAPAHEAKARLQVKATYLAPAGMHASFTLAGAAADEDTATVTSGVDLKARMWRVSFSCSNAGFVGGTNDAGVTIDSMQVTDAVVDSVVYASDSAWVPQFGGVAQIWMSGPATRWLRNGTSESVTYFNHHEIARQAPDSIITEQGPQGKKAMLRVNPGALNQLLRYEGGTFCTTDWRHKRGSATLQEVAP